MENLKINIPEGYEIDREKSTFEEIVFKKKVEKKWVDDKHVIINGYFINSASSICGKVGFNRPADYNSFPYYKQAESALAYSRLAQIIEYDKRFGGCITDEEWNTSEIKYVIFRKNNSIVTDCLTNIYQFLAFHTKEQCNLFLQENEELIKKYFML
jgi:hypothetical protein